MLSTRRPLMAAAVFVGACLFAALPVAQESTDIDIDSAADSSSPPGFTVEKPKLTDPHYVVIPYGKMTVEEFKYHCKTNVVSPHFYTSNLSIPDESPDPDSEIVGNHYKSWVGKEVEPDGDVGVIIIGPRSAITFVDVLLITLLAMGAAIGIGVMFTKNAVGTVAAALKRLADRVDDLGPPAPRS